MPHFDLRFIMIYYLYSARRIRGEGKMHDFSFRVRVERYSFAGQPCSRHDASDSARNETERNSDFALIGFLYRRCEKNHVERISENRWELITELRYESHPDRSHQLPRDEGFHILTDDDFHAIEKCIKINDVFDNSIIYKYINTTVDRNTIIF